MGVGHLKSGRSRMSGNNLSYEIFRGANCGCSFFFRLVLGSLSVSVLTFTGRLFFPSIYLSQSVDL